MHITHLRAPGFHAHDINVVLEPLTAILGQPFSGKSALTMALQIGLVGRVPALGKELAATFKNASASEMFIGLTFSNGKTNTFSITKDAEGALKSTRAFDCVFPDVLIDPWAYLGLTAQKRLEYVMDRTSLARVYDAHDLQTMLNDGVPKALHLGLRPAKPVQQMADVLSVLNARLKTTKAEIKRLTGVVDTYKTTSPQGKDYTTELEAARSAERKAIEAKGAHGVRDYKSEIDRAEHDKRAADKEAQRCDKERFSLIELEQKNKKLAACPTCNTKGAKWFPQWKKYNDACIREALDLKSKSDAESARIERLIAQLKRDEAKPDKAYAKFQNACAAAADQVRKLEILQMEYLNWKRKADDCQKAILDRQAREAEQVAVKAQIGRLVDYQSNVVAKVFKHLLATANDFVRGLLASELVYNDGLQELGRWQGVQWVSMDVFSGVERMLSYVGLQVALAQESPAKIVILDDPYAGMPLVWKIRVVNRMRQLLVNGVVNQALFVDYDEAAYDASDVHKVLV